MQVVPRDRRVHAGWVDPVAAPVCSGWIDRRCRRASDAAPRVARAAPPDARHRSAGGGRSCPAWSTRTRISSCRTLLARWRLPTVSCRGCARCWACASARRPRWQPSPTPSSARLARWRRRAPPASATSATPTLPCCRWRPRRCRACTSARRSGSSAPTPQRVAAETRLGAVLAQTRLAELGCTRLVASVAPHAPYSTSAPLIQSLAAGMPVAGVSMATCRRATCRRSTWANRPRRWSSSRPGPARSAPCSPISAPGTTRGCRLVSHPWRTCSNSARSMPGCSSCTARSSAPANCGRWPTPARPSCCAPGATDGSARACLPSPRPSRRACAWRSAPTAWPASRT